MLSETPTNKAVNFVTGAGGFLQQVIFGYTGLRLGERGLEPAFAPVLPSTIKRLVLPEPAASGGSATTSVGGLDGPAHPAARARRGATISGDSRRGCCCSDLRAPLGTLQVPAARAPSPYSPCSPFPSPAWTIRPRTRATRPASTGTPKTTRSRSISTRGAGGSWRLGRCGQRERRLHRARCERAAGSARLGRPRGGGVGLGSDPDDRIPSRGRDAARIQIGWFVLGSMRVERDFQYAKRQHLRHSAAPPFVVAEESLLVADVAKLPATERARHLALLAHRGLSELRARLEPAHDHPPGGGQRSRAHHPAIAGRPQPPDGSS